MTGTFRNALDIGSRVDRYEIEAIIGHGGFGISYRALDIESAKHIALKEYLPIELATREPDRSVYPLSESHLDNFRWGLERFLDEARLLARFHHPNIVRVHRTFEGNGTAYMVMGYEEGESLAARLERERTLPGDALTAMTLALLDGMELVHDAGFIHRDIKPGNIYLRRNGSPVLLDFGSARQALGGKTRTLTALVSAGYAPIEQYFSRSDAQGPWTDIYGLGATLYHAVSGGPPLDAVERSRGVLGSTHDILPPAVEVARGEYPSHLLAAIDHALCLAEHDRPRSVREWRNELTGRTSPPRPAVTVAATSPTRVATLDASPARAPTTRRAATRVALLGLLASSSLLLGVLTWKPGDEHGAAAVNATDATRPVRASIASSPPVVSDGAAAGSHPGAGGSTREPDDSARAGGIAQPASGRDDAGTAGPRPRVGNEPTRARRETNDEGLRPETRPSVTTAPKSVAATPGAPSADAADPGAELEADRRATIDALLAAAARDIERLRLTSPKAGNAHARYREVLELEADNAQALRGLERIVEKYLALSEARRASGDLALAEEYLDRAARVLPQSQRLAHARGALRAAREENPPPSEIAASTTAAIVEGRDDAVASALPPSGPTARSIDGTAPAERSEAARSAENALGDSRDGGHSSSAISPAVEAAAVRRVAILPYVGRQFALSAINRTLTYKLTRAIERAKNFQLVYSYYDENGHPDYLDNVDALWLGGPVDYRLNEVRAAELAESLDADIVLTARRPLEFSGQWGHSYSFSRFEVDVYLLDVKRRILFHERDKIENSEEIFIRLVRKAEILATTDAPPAPSSPVITARATRPGEPADRAPLRIAILPLGRIGTENQDYLPTD